MYAVHLLHPAITGHFRNSFAVPFCMYTTNRFSNTWADQCTKAFKNVGPGELEDLRMDSFIAFSATWRTTKTTSDLSIYLSSNSKPTSSWSYICAYVYAVVYLWPPILESLSVALCLSLSLYPSIHCWIQFNSIPLVYLTYSFYLIYRFYLVQSILPNVIYLIYFIGSIYSVCRIYTVRLSIYLSINQIINMYSISEGISEGWSKFLCRICHLCCCWTKIIHLCSLIFGHLHVWPSST